VTHDGCWVGVRVDVDAGYRQPGETGGGRDRGGREGGCLRHTMGAVRRAAERGASEVVLLHSLAGGSGSGLGSRLLEHLRDAYGKRYILAASVAPRPDGDTPLQHYNSVLAAQFLHAYADGVLLFQVRMRSLLLLLLLLCPLSRPCRPCRRSGSLPPLCDECVEWSRGSSLQAAQGDFRAADGVHIS